MLLCAFLSVNPYTRLTVATLPPANLAMALYGTQEHLNPVELIAVLLTLIFSEYISCIGLW